MKKTYTKPQLYAETFELLEHIANCYNDGSYTAHHADTPDNYCKIELGKGGSIFIEASPNCADATMPYEPSLDEGGSMLSILLSSMCYTTFDSGTMYGS